MRNCGFPPSSPPFSIYLSRDSALEQYSGFVGLKIQPQPTPLFLKTGGICQVFPFSTVPPSLVFQEEKEKGKSRPGQKTFFSRPPPSMYVYALLCTPPRLPQKRKKQTMKSALRSLRCAWNYVFVPLPPLLPPLEFFPPSSSPCVRTHTHLENNEKNLPLRVSVFPQKSRFFIPPIKILIEHTLYTVVVTPMRLRAGLTYRC